MTAKYRNMSLRFDKLCIIIKAGVLSALPHIISAFNYLICYERKSKFGLDTMCDKSECMQLGDCEYCNWSCNLLVSMCKQNAQIT